MIKVKRVLHPVRPVNSSFSRIFPEPDEAAAVRAFQGKQRQRHGGFGEGGGEMSVSFTPIAGENKPNLSY